MCDCVNMIKKYISLNPDSELKFNSDITEAIQLKEWYEAQNNDEIQNFVNNAELIGIENSTIDKILQLPPRSNFNTIGVCFDISDLKIFNRSKSDKIELIKRTVTLIDQTMMPIILTLWNAEAQEFGFNYIDTVVSIKNAIIVDKNSTRYCNKIVYLIHIL